MRTLRQSREAAALAEGPTCYDHLAGRAGVELLAGLLRLGWLEERSGRTDRGDTSALRFEITGAGAKRDPSGVRRRSVRVTPAGTEGLACTFGVEFL